MAATFFLKASRNVPKQWLDEVAIPYLGDDCLIFPYGLDSQGYGKLRNGLGARAHRYVCKATCGPPPSREAFACHCKPDGSACESRACCNPAHLRWDDHIGNMADALRHAGNPRWKDVALRPRKRSGKYAWKRPTRQFGSLI